MPNTGERREITKRVNAKEAEMVQQSKKLVSRTREITADTDAKNLARTSGTNKRKSARSPKPN
jgi:hypothetical protein